MWDTLLKPKIYSISSSNLYILYMNKCFLFILLDNLFFSMHDFANVLIALKSQRDREDMIEFVRNTPMEFKEYYIQMQAAKRSQAPLPSEVITK